MARSLGPVTSPMFNPRSLIATVVLSYFCCCAVLFWSTVDTVGFWRNLINGQKWSLSSGISWLRVADGISRRQWRHQYWISYISWESTSKKWLSPTSSSRTQGTNRNKLALCRLNFIKKLYGKRERERERERETCVQWRRKSPHEWPLIEKNVSFSASCFKRHLTGAGILSNSEGLVYNSLDFIRARRWKPISLTSQNLSQSQPESKSQDVQVGISYW